MVLRNSSLSVINYFYIYPTQLMLTIKRKYISGMMFLLVGMCYFTIMSSLDIHYYGKSLLAILPLQVISLIYMTYKKKAETQ